MPSFKIVASRRPEINATSTRRNTFTRPSPPVGPGKAATITGLTTIKWRNKERRDIVSLGHCAILGDRNELRSVLKSLLLSALSTTKRRRTLRMRMTTTSTGGILNLSESTTTSYQPTYRDKRPSLGSKRTTSRAKKVLRWFIIPFSRGETSPVSLNPPAGQLVWQVTRTRISSARSVEFSFRDFRRFQVAIDLTNEALTHRKMTHRTWERWEQRSVEIAPELAGAQIILLKFCCFELLLQK